jgi:hypothetical protein
MNKNTKDKPVYRIVVLAKNTKEQTLIEKYLKSKKVLFHSASANTQQKSPEEIALETEFSSLSNLTRFRLEKAELEEVTAGNKTRLDFLKKTVQSLRAAKKKEAASAE